MKVILGTLNFDYKCVSEEFNLEKINDFLAISKKNGITDIDTAYYYGNAEKYLGLCMKSNEEYQNCFKFSSKANPWKNNDFTLNKLGELSYAGIQRQCNTSLKNLQISQFDKYYMHCWDYETDVAETCESFDKLYRDEKINKFGVSNISKSQMESILSVCEQNQWIHPSVYQGMYNLYCRKVEDIIPLLRENKMEFVAYNPLAGGILTGKQKVENRVGRFSNNEIYTKIFWEDELISKSSKLTSSIALRWLKYHSMLKNEDGIIIGSSTREQLKDNISQLASGDVLNEDEKMVVLDFYSFASKFQPNYYY